MNELGSPKDLGGRFKMLYRPDRLIDYLLILIPFLFYPLLNAFYTSTIMPAYPGGALLLDVVIHLPLVLVGLWRRSAPVTLFWSAVLVSQLSFVTGRLYAYYGIQTILWAALLIALVLVASKVLWDNRKDPLTVGFGLIMVGMAIAAGLLNALAMARPLALLIWRGGSGITQLAANSVLDRSLLQAYIQLRDVAELYSILALALFFVPTNRGLRWLGLGLAGLVMGLSHRFLLDFQSEPNLMAPWIYFAWAIIPILIVVSGWWLERSTRRTMDAAAA